MQTITKQQIWKMAEIQLHFLEEIAIKLANGGCIAIRNSTFYVLNKISNKVAIYVMVVKGEKGWYSENAAFRKWVNQWA